MPLVTLVPWIPPLISKKSLTVLKFRFLSDLSLIEKEEHRAATDFTVYEAIQTFGLKLEESLKHLWDIENNVGMKEFPTTLNSYC